MPNNRPLRDTSADLISKRRRVQSHERRRTAFKWILLIVLTALLVVVLKEVIPPLLERMDIVDTTYRPRDVERQFNQIQKLREGESTKTQKGNFQQVR